MATATIQLLAWNPGALHTCTACIAPVTKRNAWPQVSICGCIGGWGATPSRARCCIICGAARLSDLAAWGGCADQRVGGVAVTEVGTMDTMMLMEAFTTMQRQNHRLQAKILSMEDVSDRLQQLEEVNRKLAKARDTSVE